MQLACGDKVIDLRSPIVMGVINVTPDSFSDGGALPDARAAAESAQRMVADGAAIIDIGGESTRPGARPVPVEVELARVIPAVERIAALDVIVSVDTSHPEVMSAAARAGARMINDVRALQIPGALEAVAESGVAVCLMHMRGEPATMQSDLHYEDVLGEVVRFLTCRSAACESAGIRRDRIAIDPGFGFGKSLEQNLVLLRGLRLLAAMGLPLLVGLSRKSMIGTLTGRTVENRLPGSLALAVIAVLQGARIVRAHDVGATVDALRIAGAYLEERGLEA